MNKNLMRIILMNIKQIIEKVTPSNDGGEIVGYEKKVVY